MHMEEGRESPIWALEEALRRLQARCDRESDEAVIPHPKTSVPRYAIRLLAEHIARHEQPPVDPDVLAVREIISAAYQGVPGWSEARSYEASDNSPWFQAALAAYRKHKQEKTDD